MLRSQSSEPLIKSCSRFPRLLLQHYNPTPHALLRERWFEVTESGLLFRPKLAPYVSHIARIS
jgi:hypothetical protein